MQQRRGEMGPFICLLALRLAASRIKVTLSSPSASTLSVYKPIKQEQQLLNQQQDDTHQQIQIIAVLHLTSQILLITYNTMEVLYKCIQYEY